jgi:hypothetical protein
MLGSMNPTGTAWNWFQFNQAGGLRKVIDQVFMLLFIELFRHSNENHNGTTRYSRKNYG